MSKKKNMLIIAGILLILGGTILGTKSWLKDSKDMNTDLIINTGSFELSINNSLPWEVLTKDETEIDDANRGNEFTNVRPGDVFKKSIAIKNEGTLKQHLTIDDVSDKIETEYFTILYEGLEAVHDKQINSKETKEIVVTISTKADLMNKENHSGKPINLSSIVPKKTIEANQINKTLVTPR